MFRTIEKESGGSGPEFLSTHPAPANRYENINREAEQLDVSSNPIKMTRGYERIQAKLRSLPRAKSMKEIDEENKRGGGGGGRTPTTGRYESRVEYPSTRTRSYSPSNWLQLSVPENWQSFTAESEIWYAPEGAYGDQGITHGALIGIYKTQSRNLGDATNEYVRGILQANNYLRQSGGYTRTTISGRTAYSTVLSGTSPVTGRTEVATVYTTGLSDGSLFYVVTVAPQNEASRYNYPFRNMIRSIRLSD
jgi:hypothetical protein